MNYRSFKKIVLCIIVLIQQISFDAYFMLKNIKGTDDILNDDYKYLSLPCGAVAWETGVIRRLYDYGQISPVYDQDSAGRNIITGYAELEQMSSIVRLIHTLFYRVPGSSGEADFGVTKQLEYQDPIKIAQTIAMVLVSCQSLQQADQSFSDAVNALTKGLDGAWQERAQILIQNPLSKDQTSKKDRNLYDVFVEACQHKNFDFGAASLTKSQRVQHLAVMKKFFVSYNGINTLLTRLLKSPARLGADMAQLMLQSLRESDRKELPGLYPPHTPYMVLLAFVYKTCSEHRNALKTFYEQLNNNLGKKVLRVDLDHSWIEESFAPVTQPEALATVNTIFKANDQVQSIAQNYASLVYNALQIRGLPAAVGYSTAFYEYVPGKKTAGFPDCMCNSIRNFVNNFAYDSTSNKFTLKKLQETTGRGSVHPSLETFLQSFSNVSASLSQDAHNQWLNVVSNIPYATYIQGVDRETGQSINSSRDQKGYISVAQGDDALLDWLKANGHQLLGQNQQGYELKPSIKNIIIVLDHLLQLHLFEQAGGLAKEFVRPDFIKEYFPKLCSTLKANGFLATQENAQEAELAKDFDALDYKARPLYSTISLAGITCQFKTWLGHGELKLIKADVEGSRQEQVLQSLFKTLPDFADKVSLSLLATNVLSRHEVELDHVLKKTDILYINLCATPVENTSFLIEWINNGGLKSCMDEAVPLIVRIAIKNFLLRLTHDERDIQVHILHAFIEGLGKNEVTAKEVIDASKKIVEDALELFESGDVDLRVGVLEVFNAFVRQDLIFGEAIELAAEGMDDGEDDVQEAAKELVSELLKKSTEYRSSNDFDKQKKGFEILRVLVAYGLALDEAIDIADEKIDSQNNFEITQAITIYKELVEQGEDLDKITAIAKRSIKTQDHDVKAECGKLLKALQAATKKEFEKSDKNPKVRARALRRFKDLVTSDRSLDVILRIAQKGLADWHAEVNREALDLMSAFMKNPGYAQATKSKIYEILGGNDQMIAYPTRVALESLFNQK